MVFHCKVKFILLVIVILVNFLTFCFSKDLRETTFTGKKYAHEIFDINSTSGSNSMNSAPTNDVSQDSFKFGIYAAVVITLHIVLLIALIVFAITGTAAFVCSFTNCRHLFTGMAGSGAESPRPNFSPSYAQRNAMAVKSWEDMKPVAHGLQVNYDKFNDGFVDKY